MRDHGAALGHVHVAPCLRCIFPGALLISAHPTGHLPPQNALIFFHRVLRRLPAYTGPPAAYARWWQRRSPLRFAGWRLW
jgi:hypothetical protein